jgi:alkylhydroperoxidase family enzyme
VAFIETSDGESTNMERAFARRPEVLAAWQQLNGAIKATSDLRRYELATLAAARRLRSSYCCLAHGKVLAEQFYDYESVPKLPTGWTTRIARSWRSPRRWSPTRRRSRKPMSTSSAHTA